MPIHGGARSLFQGVQVLQTGAGGAELVQAHDGDAAAPTHIHGLDQGAVGTEGLQGLVADPFAAPHVQVREGGAPLRQGLWGAGRRERRCAGRGRGARLHESLGHTQSARPTVVVFGGRNAVLYFYSPFPFP